MNAPLWVAVPVIALVTLAARADVRTRRIPNRLTFSALLLGVAVHAALSGLPGLLASLAGAALAAVLIPGWLCKWMGAGDVKLMAAVGAWLTWPQAVIGLLASLVAGGVIATLLALRRGMLLQALRNAAWIGIGTLSRAGGAAAPAPITTGVRFPFALAVLAGSTFALWVKP